MSDKTLYRAKDDRMIGGVCAGIAHYFELDPTVVRLLAVLGAALSSGAVVIAYLVMWAAVPEEGSPAKGGDTMTGESTHAPAGDPGTPAAPAEHAPPAPAAPVTAPAPPAPTVLPPVPPAPPRPPAARGQGSIWVGIALVFIGLVLLVQLFAPEIRLWAFWPVVLIVWGLIVIFRPRRHG